MRRTLRGMLLASILALAGGPAAHAALVPIADPALLGGNDALDWGQFGLSIQPDPFAARTGLGADATVGQVAGGFEVLKQGGGWHGNFAAGTFVLWTRGNQGVGVGGPVTIDLGPTGLAAAGASLQPSGYGAYSARLEAFDAAGASLGSVDATGVSTDAASNPNDPGVPTFLGLRDPAGPDIHRLVFSLTAAPPGVPLGDFGLGPVALDDPNPPPVPVPGPAGAVLIGIGLAGAGIRRIFLAGGRRTG